MSWNPQPAIGGANWFGNPSLTTNTQLISTTGGLQTKIISTGVSLTNTSNFLQSEINAIVGGGTTSLWANYRAINNVDLSGNNLSNADKITARFLSTLDLQVSSINGAEIILTASNVTIQNITMSNGTVTASNVTTSNSALTRTANAIGAAGAAVSQVNQAIGGVLSNTFGVVQQAYWGVAVAGQVVDLANGIVQLATSAQAQADSRELNLISGPAGPPGQNTPVYETFNHTTQLQFSTLGSPIYTVFRTTDQRYPNQTLGREVFISTIIPAGTKVVRSVSDPLNMPIISTQLLSTTNYIQSFGQWSAVLGNDYNLTASTLTADYIRASTISTIYLSTAYAYISSLNGVNVTTLLTPAVLPSGLVSTPWNIGLVSTPNLSGLVSTPNLSGLVSTPNLIGLVSTPNLLNLVSTANLANLQSLTISAGTISVDKLYVSTLYASTTVTTNIVDTYIFTSTATLSSLNITGGMVFSTLFQPSYVITGIATSTATQYTSISSLTQNIMNWTVKGTLTASEVIADMPGGTSIYNGNESEWLNKLLMYSSPYVAPIIVYLLNANTVGDFFDFQNKSGVTGNTVTFYQGGAAVLVVQPGDANIYRWTWNGSVFVLSSNPTPTGQAVLNQFAMTQGFNVTTLSTPNELVISAGETNFTGAVNMPYGFITNMYATNAGISSIGSYNFNTKPQLINGSYDINKSFNITSTSFAAISNYTNNILNYEYDMTLPGTDSPVVTYPAPIGPNPKIYFSWAQYGTWGGVVNTWGYDDSTSDIILYLPTNTNPASATTDIRASANNIIVVYGGGASQVSITPVNTYRFTWDGSSWTYSTSAPAAPVTTYTNFNLRQHFAGVNISTSDILTVDATSIFLNAPVQANSLVALQGALSTLTTSYITASYLSTVNLDAGVLKVGAITGTIPSLTVTNLTVPGTATIGQVNSLFNNTSYLYTSNVGYISMLNGNNISLSNNNVGNRFVKTNATGTFYQSTNSASAPYTALRAEFDAYLVRPTINKSVPVGSIITIRPDLSVVVNGLPQGYTLFSTIFTVTPSDGTTIINISTPSVSGAAWQVETTNSYNINIYIQNTSYSTYAANGFVTTINYNNGTYTTPTTALPSAWATPTLTSNNNFAIVKDVGVTTILNNYGDLGITNSGNFYYNSAKFYQFSQKLQGGFSNFRGLVGHGSATATLVDANGLTFSSSQYDCAVYLYGWSVTSQPSLATNEAGIAPFVSGGVWNVRGTIWSSTVPGLATGGSCYWQVFAIMTPKGYYGESYQNTYFDTVTEEPPPYMNFSTISYIPLPVLTVSSITASTITMEASENISLLANVAPPAFVSTGSIYIAGTNNVNLVGNITAVGGFTDVDLDAVTGNVNIVATAKDINLNANSNVNIVASNGNVNLTASNLIYTGASPLWGSNVGNSLGLYRPLRFYYEPPTAAGQSAEINIEAHPADAGVHFSLRYGVDLAAGYAYLLCEWPGYIVVPMKIFGQDIALEGGETVHINANSGDATIKATGATNISSTTVNVRAPNINLYGNVGMNGTLYMNSNNIEQIRTLYFQTSGNIDAYQYAGVNYLNINAPTTTGSGTGRLSFYGQKGNMTFDDNVTLGGNGSNYVGVYNQYGYLQIAADQNIYIGGGGGSIGGVSAVNLSGLTIVRHNGSYAGGLITQITNTAAAASAPGNRFGTLFITADYPAATGESGVQISLETGNYGGAIFGGIKQGVGSFISLATNNNAGAQTERMRIDGVNGYVGIGTTTPYYQLDVIGDVRVSGNLYANNVIYFGYGGNIASAQSGGINYLDINAPADTGSGTARLRIVGSKGRLDFDDNVTLAGTGSNQVGMFNQYGSVYLDSYQNVHLVGAGSHRGSENQVIVNGLIYSDSRIYTGTSGQGFLQQNGNGFIETRVDYGAYGGLNMNGYFQVCQTGTTTAVFTVPSDTNGNMSYNNGTGGFGIGTTSPAYRLDVAGDAHVSGTFNRTLSSSVIAQPVLQYGTTTGSGTSGSVTVTLPTGYTTAASYVAFAVMQDSTEAKIAVSRTSYISITIYWSQGGSGSHTLAWNTMGT